MENMNDIKFFGREKPKVPQLLLDVTYESMRRNRRGVFERRLSTEDEEQQTRPVGVRNLKGGSGKKTQEDKSLRFRKKKVEDDDDEDNEPEEPMYRSPGERRMGFLVVGDQHRFVQGRGQDTTSYLYPDAPPIDFSFCLLSTAEEITTSGEPPNRKRNYKFPEKTGDDRYKTSSVRMSYNLLDNIDGILAVLYKILDGGPFGLRWLDLSFNHILDLDEDSLSQMPNLKILYMHGNSIADMKVIQKLQCLPSLHTLTMHGNPVEEEDGYRACTLYYLPDLKHLDFIGITKTDKANAAKFGKLFEPYWERKHIEIENAVRLMKAAAEVSQTEELMKAVEEEEEEDISD